MDSNRTVCVGVTFKSINHIECFVSRVGGSLIVFISLFSLLFNIRYIYWLYYHRENRSHHYLFILSMIFSSLSVIVIIVPSVILQCLTCTRLCSSFYCQLEGFISYLNGCVHMFMLMMISIIRYNLVVHKNQTKEFFQQHTYISISICWLFAFIFALAPLLHWNKYIPEGLGFHCGLNWFDRSINSQIYLILSFLCVYIIPLIVLLIINIYVYYIIRSLIVRTTKQPSLLIDDLIEDKQRLSPFVSASHSSNTISTQKLRIRPATDNNQVDYIIRLNRLKADRHFALASIFLVSEYILSWTPYAFVALFYLFNIQFIIEQPLFITICAFIAKISMIINPFIYISTIKINQVKKILFFKKCSCQICRFK